MNEVAKRMIGRDYKDIPQPVIKTFDERTVRLMQIEFEAKGVPYTGMINGNESKMVVSASNLSEIDRIIADINIGDRLKERLGENYKIGIAPDSRRRVTNTVTGEEELFDSFSAANYAYELREVEKANQEETKEQDEELFINESFRSYIDAMQESISQSDWNEAKNACDNINDLIDRALGIDKEDTSVSPVEETINRLSLEELTRAINTQENRILALAENRDFDGMRAAIELRDSLKKNYDERKSAEQSEVLTVDDVQTLRSIEPKRKSVQNMLDTEVAQVPRFEKQQAEKMGSKSAFEMRKEGGNDWRNDESHTVKIVKLQKHIIPENLTDVRRDRSIHRGSFINADTGVNIAFSKRSIDESVAKALQEDKRGMSVEGRITALYNMQDLIENAVCFDTKLSEVGGKRSDNTIFMHQFYAPMQLDDAFYLAKLAVEEAYFTDMQGNIDTNNRVYSVLDMKITPVEANRIFSPTSAVENDNADTSTSVTTISIPQLYELVKTYDKNFFENPLAFGRTEREEEITLHAAAEDAIHTYQNELSNNKDQSRELTRSTNRNGDTVIGNKEFRYIADKKYISGLDHATANILIEKLNEIGLDLSSSFRADGTATVTVSGDENKAKAQDIIDGLNTLEKDFEQLSDASNRLNEISDASDKKGITIDGKDGTWSVINTMTYGGKELSLLENDEQGEDVPYIILDGDNNVLSDKVYSFEDFTSVYTESEVALGLVSGKGITLTVAEFDNGSDIETAVFDDHLSIEDIERTQEYQDYAEKSEFEDITVRAEQYLIGFSELSALTEEQAEYIRANLAAVKNDASLWDSKTATLNKFKDIADRQAERAIDINEALADSVGSPEEKAELQREFDSLTGAEQNFIPTRLFTVEQNDTVQYFTTDKTADELLTIAANSDSRTRHVSISDYIQKQDIPDKTAYTGLGAERIDVSAEYAASMWENGFEVYVDGEAVEPHTPDSSMELFRTDRAFSAQFGDVKKQQMIDFISNEIEELDMTMPEDKYVYVRDFIDEEEDDPFDWGDGQNVYLNITRALIEHKFDFIDDYLTSVKNDYDSIRAERAQDVLFEYKHYSPPSVEYTTVIDIPEYNFYVDLKNIDELYLKNDYSYYEGGIDSDGHERKDNYSRQTESLTITLDPLGTAVVERYDSKSEYNIVQTEYDLSDKVDVSELRDKVSNFIESSDELSITSKKEEVSTDIQIHEQRELTNREKYFLEKDLAPDLVDQCLAYDEVEDLSYVLFDNDLRPQHSTGTFGNGLSGEFAVELRERMRNGEDISAELGKAILGKVTNSRFHPTESRWVTEDVKLRHDLDTVTVIYGDLQHDVPYSSVGAEVIKRAREEYLDIEVYRATEDGILPDTKFTKLDDEKRMFFDLHQYVPQPETSPWGEIDRIHEINNGIFDVSTPSHGGIMIKNDIAAKILTKEARDIAFNEDGFTCFEEDCAAAVAFRELIDKDLFRNIDDYFRTNYDTPWEKKRESFNDSLDRTLRSYYPDYWTKRAETIIGAVSEEKQAELSGQMMFGQEKAYSPITKEMYHPDTADMKWLKIKGEDVPALRMDIDVSDELFERLAENGLVKDKYSLDRVMVDVVGDNWKAICIPDSYGNVANNIPADTVLTFEEMQTYNEVTSEVIDRSRNSRDIEQDNGQMVMGFDPVPQNIEDSFDTLEVHAVSETMYEGVWAFLDDNNSVYIGKPQNILNGTYDNSDNSLVKLSDNEKIYDFLTVGENGFEQSQQQMLDLRRMSIEDYREITHLQETVLSSYEQKYDLKFAMERFKAVSDETVMVQHDKGKAQNYRTNALDMATGGQVGRFLANVKAIETLRTLEKEDRYATQEEQAVLAKYSGWGGLSQAFDSRNAAWGGRYNQLKELLTDSEYREARASITSAFYTPESVKNAIYQGLAQLGFSGGEVLEPSCGIGGFIGAMPESMADHSKIHGVELDSISGRIAKKLYPESDIQVKGFEKTTFADNSFDVVVGNIPFGDFSVNDKDYNKHNFSIHDYFAAKTIDKVKPNGVVAIVTSKFTMDKQDERLRKYLAERATLLGAVRLPAGTFSGADNVTTDILFLQKKERPSVDDPSWVHMSQTTDGIPCNKYFTEHPEMILGKMEFDKRMQGKYGEDSKITVCSPLYDDDPIRFENDLNRAVANIKGTIDTQRTISTPSARTADILPADPDVRNFTHTMVNGQLYFRKNDEMIRVSETGKRLERMIGLHEIREAVFNVINAQIEDCSDKELKALQDKLNSVYDRFVKKNGNVNDKANRNVFGSDDDYNTLCALEVADKNTGKLVKADIFSKRTILAVQEITHVETAEEALHMSIEQKGKVDIGYMAELCDKKEEDIISELGDSIYKDPAKADESIPFSGYVEKSEYLSGNVRERLDLARIYAKSDPDYERNVKALEEAIPPTIEAPDITASIGVSWVDVEDYSTFFKEEMNGNMNYHTMRRDLSGEYHVEHARNGDFDSRMKYGTERMNSYQIFENLLNHRDITVKDYNEDKKPIPNLKETEKARQKAEEMKRAFSAWLFKDFDRRQKYVERYNRLFNSIVGRTYDGSRQTFPNRNPNIKLRAHQLDAVMRGKLGGNTLLAHCVGAGKSFEMDTIVMEKKRLGLISKACVVVPKHLTMQTALEWQRLYPTAKLLVATPKDFEKNKRQEFLAKCVTGEYDAVIMSYEQFGKIGMSLEYQENFIQKQIDQLENALEDVRDKGNSISVSDIERQKKRLKTRLEKLNEKPRDESLTFEQMGFDYLVVDEAHNYKNCLVISKMSNVSGVQTTGAAKSEDMLMKGQYMTERYGDSTQLWATGTPISNSMVELYSMTRYLRPDLLQKAGLQNFDDWAGNFGNVVTQLEMKPAGDGFRMKKRFAEFVNLPELMQMYKEFADIRMGDTVSIPNIPTMKGGKVQIVKSPIDELQKEYMKVLAQRSERIHSGGVDSKEDNMLKVTHEARLLGLDGRTINPDWKPDPDCKVMKLCDNLENIYKETDKDKGVQIVFCDIAIHDTNGRFSVYKAIKDELENRGIPRDEVCFAGDAKNDAERTKMFEQLRKGEKRVIIASTSKLGTGANIQDRIAAIHHLDIPWKPSDLEQQNGRGLRQGNMYKEVGIYQYVTENTFDAYMLGIITAKAKFISQVMTSKNVSRTCKDVDEMVLNYAEMQAIASGNPLLAKKVQLEYDVATLRMLNNEHTKKLFELDDMVKRTLPNSIAKKTELLAKAQDDLNRYKGNKPENSEDFSIKLNGTEFTERKEAAQELEKLINRCIANSGSLSVGEYSGFKLSIEKNPNYGTMGYIDGDVPCYLKMQGELTYECPLKINNGTGNITRIENLPENTIAKRTADIAESLQTDKNNLESAKAELDKPFSQADELKAKEQELAEVNAELGTDKSDDVISVGGESDDKSEEQNVGDDEEIDKADKRDDTMAIKGYDISHLQKKAQSQDIPSQNAPEPPKAKKHDPKL